MGKQTGEQLLRMRCVFLAHFKQLFDTSNTTGIFQFRTSYSRRCFPSSLKFLFSWLAKASSCSPPPPPTKMTLCMALPSQTHNTRSVFLRSWWHTGTGAVPRACSSPWGTLQDRDLDIWLHEIQLVTWFGRLGTRANTDSGYRTESTRSAWRFQGVGVVLGLKVPLRVTSSNLLL